MPCVHGTLDRVVEEAQERDEVSDDARLEEYDELVEDVAEAHRAVIGRENRLSRVE